MALRGDRFGIDFNPVVDRLRIVSDENQNLRVNVDTGALADFDLVTPGTQPDQDLQYAAGDPNAGQDPSVTGVAYRNSQASAFDADPTTPDPGKTTELYDIDARTDDMSEQDPPNNGTLITEDRSVSTPTGSSGSTSSPGALRPMATGAMRPLTPPPKVAPSSTRSAWTRATRPEIGKIGGGMTRVEGLAIPIGQR